MKKIKIIYLLTVLFVFLFLLPILSATGQFNNLTFQDILKYIGEKNPTILKAKKLVNQNELNYNRSWTNFLPQLGLSINKNRSGISSGISDSYSYGINGSFSIFSGFGDVSNLNTNLKQLSIQEIIYLRTVSDKVFTVSQSFTNLLWGQETVFLANDILKKRTENYNLVKFKYESGLEDKGSLLRTEADKLQAQFELQKAERYLKTASIRLLKEMGSDDFNIVKVTGTLNVSIPVKEFSLDLVKAIPEYIIAKLNIEKSISQITFAKSKFYPEINLNGSISRSDDHWPPEKDNRQVGLSLSYLFFPGGSNIFDFKIANLNKQINENILKETELQLVEKLQSLYNSMIDNIENIKVREKYLDAAKEQEEIIFTKYLNGLASYQDWYIVENDFINAQKDLLNSKLNTVISILNWNNFLGEGVQLIYKY